MSYSLLPLNVREHICTFAGARGAALLGETSTTFKEEIRSFLNDERVAKLWLKHHFQLSPFQSESGSATYKRISEMLSPSWSPVCLRMFDALSLQDLQLLQRDEGKQNPVF